MPGGSRHILDSPALAQSRLDDIVAEELMDPVNICKVRERTTVVVYLRGYFNWILGYMWLEIWHKIGLPGDWCLSTVLCTRRGACYRRIGLDWYFNCMLYCLPMWLSLAMTRVLFSVVSAYTEWWGAGVVVCLEQGADLHMAQLMSLPLTVSCFSKIQIGVTFLVSADLGSPGKRAVKRVCVSLLIRVPLWKENGWSCRHQSR